MKLTVKKTIQREVEVSFPAYKEYGSDCYKIIDENNCIEVESNEELFCHSGIKIHVKQICFLSDILLNGTDITEDHFNEKFIEAFSKIKSHKPKYSVI